MVETHPPADFADATVIPSVERKSLLRSSLPQRRLWFSEQMGQRGLEFIFPYALRLRGEIDVAALSGAIDAVVERHEPLRTTFTVVDGEPYQVVREPRPVNLRVEPVPGTSPAEREQALPGLLRRVVEQPFDLEAGPVMRVALFGLGECDHVLLVVVHHIATDGWSMDVLFRELAQGYAALREGRRPEFAPLAVQYADFAEWQWAQWERGTFAEDLAYWRRQLAGAPALLELPTDRPRPPVQSFRGDWITFDVDADLRSRIEELARASGTTSFTVLMATFQLALGRWAGHTDVVVGTPVANRPVPETEPLVGFFVNLVPIRTRLDEREDFRTLLRQVRETTLDAYEHQEVSFDRMVEELRPERTLACNPIFQVTLALESAQPVQLAGLDVEPVDARPDVTRYDLAFDYWPADHGGLRFDAYFALDLFDRVTVERFAARFVNLLDAVTARPDQPLAAVVGESEADRARLAAWSITPATRPAVDPVERFRAAVDQADRTAVVAPDGALTFAELDSRSAALAELLAARGAGPGRVVAVCLPRSVDLVVALLAVWRVGAAYVPLDPAYPAQRLLFMARDSGAVLAVARTDGVGAQTLPAELAAVAVDVPAVSDRPADRVDAPVSDSDAAYVIYTSGSTGTPKGVVVSRGAVANLLCALEESGIYPASPRRVAWNASASFDASVQQWVRVCRGDTVVLLDEELRFEPGRLAAFVREQGITDLDLTPSHWQLLRESLLPDRPADPPLRLFVGGEPIAATLWSQLASDADAGLVEAVNLYGPTECTVDATAAWIRGDTPNIGRPLPGTRAYVLDSWLRPVPLGSAGELALGGPGVALGYLGRPGLTAQRFLPDTIAGDGSRMYRTGDRVRWRADGTLEYLGRIDRQVKVRGYRVELGEVEAVLGTCPGVTAAAVTLRTDVDGGAALVGYYASSSVARPTAAEVRAHLSARLPEYMVPSALVALDRLPMTPNGKVDSAALPAPGSAATDGDGGYVSPVGQIEELIAAVWAEVLGVEKVGATDNFFDLGGHSLLAIRVVARVKKRMKLTVPTTVVFEHPRLRDLAGYIEDAIRRQLAAQGN